MFFILLYTIHLIPQATLIVIALLACSDPYCKYDCDSARHYIWCLIYCFVLPHRSMGLNTFPLQWFAEKSCQSKFFFSQKKKKSTINGPHRLRLCPWWPCPWAKDTTSTAKRTHYTQYCLSLTYISPASRSSISSSGAPDEPRQM